MFIFNLFQEWTSKWDENEPKNGHTKKNRTLSSILIFTFIFTFHFHCAFKNPPPSTTALPHISTTNTTPAATTPTPTLTSTTAANQQHRGRGLGTFSFIQTGSPIPLPDEPLRPSRKSFALSFLSNSLSCRTRSESDVVDAVKGQFVWWGIIGVTKIFVKVIPMKTYQRVSSRITGTCHSPMHAIVCTTDPIPPITTHLIEVDSDPEVWWLHLYISWDGQSRYGLERVHLFAWLVPILITLTDGSQWGICPSCSFFDCLLFRLR